MKIRSMTCLIKKPVEFKERVLIQPVLQAQYLNGSVVRETVKSQASRKKETSQ